MSILTTVAVLAPSCGQTELMNVTILETFPHARAGLFHFNIFQIFDKNFR